MRKWRTRRAKDHGRKRKQQEMIGRKSNSTCQRSFIYGRSAWCTISEVCRKRKRCTVISFRDKSLDFLSSKGHAVGWLKVTLVSYLDCHISKQNLQGKEKWKNEIFDKDIQCSKIEKPWILPRVLEKMANTKILLQRSCAICGTVTPPQVIR